MLHSHPCPAASLRILVRLRLLIFTANYVFDSGKPEFDSRLCTAVLRLYQSIECVVCLALEVRLLHSVERVPQQMGIESGQLALLHPTGLCPGPTLSALPLRHLRFMQRSFC
jgi:hypothetical protein